MSQNLHLIFCFETGKKVDQKGASLKGVQWKLQYRFRQEVSEIQATLVFTFQLKLLMMNYTVQQFTVKMHQLKSLRLCLLSQLSQ